MHDAISSGSGLRLPGGRHLMTLAMYTSGALQLHALGDDLGEQLSGAADERLALQVFVRARPLADEHQVGGRIADAEYQVRAAQPASLQRWQSPMCSRSAASVAAPRSQAR